MSAWETVALGDVATINPRDEKPRSDAGISFVGMAALDEIAARTARGDEREYGEVSKGYTQFRNGDILAAKITPCWENGKIGLAQLGHDIGVGSTEFHVVRPNSRLDASYAMRLLRTPVVRANGELRMTGSGGQRRVPVQFLNTLHFPLPPIAEQRRIASILDEADAIRAKRRAQLAHLDDLPQALFREMFGGGGWEFSRLGDCIDSTLIGLVRAGSLTGPEREHSYMKMDAISSVGTLQREKLTRTDASPAEIARFSAHHGDLLLNTRNSRELVGKTAVFRGPSALINNNIMRIRFNDRANAEYVHAYLWTREGRAALERGKSGTTSVFAIYAKSLAEIAIPLPPSTVQQAFAAKVEAIHTERDHVANALSTDDELFAALQQRAFRGEL